jgi:hypothetical protein
MAGVVGLPGTSNINGCDSGNPEAAPADSAENPSKCRTLEQADPDAAPLKNFKTYPIKRDGT